MSLLAELTAKAEAAAVRIYSDAVADGHEETPEACLDFWRDWGEDQADWAVDFLTTDERARVEAAFLAAARQAMARRRCHRVIARRRGVYA